MQPASELASAVAPLCGLNGNGWSRVGGVEGGLSRASTRDAFENNSCREKQLPSHVRWGRPEAPPMSRCYLAGAGVLTGLPFSMT